MKLNQWTVSLVALGVVSLASAAKAEEKASVVQTALSSTTLGGYVDTSAQWNFGTGNANTPPYKFGGPSKADGFNLNVVQIRLEKPLDETDWAAGYRVDLWAGPDANTLGTQSTGTGNDLAIRQAYVALRTPLGKGLDWKIGVFDSIIGYESVESPSNPNFTRSYGHSIEPQTETGILATYHFCEAFSASAGVANTVYSPINSRATSGSTGVFTGGVFTPAYKMLARDYNARTPGTTLVNPGVTGYNAQAESVKTYMGSIQVTAPQSMGFLAGSTFYAGAVPGYNNSEAGSGLGDKQVSYYAGATVATPITNLRAGVAFDYLDVGSMNGYLSDTAGGLHSVYVDIPNTYSVAGYLSFQATDKLSFHGRLEYFNETLDASVDGYTYGERPKILASTVTAQYDLWKNVLSRLELRWDHSMSGPMFGSNDSFGNATAKNAWMLAANVIYKF